MKRTPKRQSPKPRETPGSKLQARVEDSGAWSEAIGDSYVLRDEISDGRHPFDLEERNARFGEAMLRFSRMIPRGPGNDRLIDQLVGAGTSVGANYCEAEERVSRKDFKNSISRCAKEAKEVMFFLRIIATAEPGLAADARKLYGRQRN